MTNLPEKPSELIRLALRYLRLAETNSAYTVDMMVWHYPDAKTGKCRIGLAGAIMAGCLDADPTKQLTPYGYPAQTVQKLCALNRFRQGRIKHALNAMHIYPDDRTPPDRAVTPYATNPDIFKTDLEYMADELEFAGL